jgi:hypothetical protein
MENPSSSCLGRVALLGFYNALDLSNIVREEVEGQVTGRVGAAH